MPLKIDEMYTWVIQTLSLGERLQLTTLILNNLASQNVAVVDEMLPFSSI